MRRTLANTLFVAGLATVTLLVLRAVFPGRAALELDVYVLVVGALAILTAVVAAQKAIPVSTTSAIAELERIDRLVVLGAANEFDLHYRLRPLLRQVAGDRLHGRYGVELDRDPERARQLLGDQLWQLVSADREVGRRTGPGLPAAELAAHVERLEAL